MRPSLVAMVAVRGVPKSKYRGVTRPGHGRLLWVAQSKPHKLYKARFASEDKAASWLALHLGVSKASLARSHPNGSSKLQVSEHKGLVWHRGRWEVRLGQKFVASFKSKELAVQRLLVVSGRPEVEMKKKGCGTRLHRKHFRIKYSLFKRYVPGDIEAVCSYEEQWSHTFFREEQVSMYGESGRACKILIGRFGG